MYQKLSKDIEDVSEWMKRLTNFTINLNSQNFQSDAINEVVEIITNITKILDQLNCTTTVSVKVLIKLQGITKEVGPSVHK